jgi:hypothetical protein
VSRYVVNALQFDEDDALSITYIDKEEALRDQGRVFRAHCLTITPESGLYDDAKDIRTAILELIADAEGVYRSEAPYVPTDDPDDEEDDDRGMGY